MKFAPDLILEKLFHAVRQHSSSLMFFVSTIFDLKNCLIYFVVRLFSMHKYLTHESIAQGWFNIDHSSVIPSIAQWEEKLVNTDAVLGLMCDRMLSDYESLNPKMRKPYTAKDIDSRFCSSLLSTLKTRFFVCGNFAD